MLGDIIAITRYKSNDPAVISEINRSSQARKIGQLIESTYVRKTIVKVRKVRIIISSGAFLLRITV